MLQDRVDRAFKYESLEIDKVVKVQFEPWQGSQVQGDVMVTGTETTTALALGAHALPLKPFCITHLPARSWPLGLFRP